MCFATSSSTWSRLRREELSQFRRSNAKSRLDELSGLTIELPELDSATMCPDRWLGLSFWAAVDQTSCRGGQRSNLWSGSASRCSSTVCAARCAGRRALDSTLIVEGTGPRIQADKCTMHRRRHSIWPSENCGRASDRRGETCAEQLGNATMRQSVAPLAFAIALVLLVGGLAAVKFTQISRSWPWASRCRRPGHRPKRWEPRSPRSKRGADPSPRSAPSPRSRGSPSATRCPASSRPSASSRAQPVQARPGSGRARQPASSARSSRRSRRARSSPTLERRPHARAGRARRDRQGAARHRRGGAQDVAAPTAARCEAQIERKIVRAPFTGRLGIRQVNLGQYLNPGTTLTVLEAIDSVFVDFTLPQQRLGRRHGRHAGAVTVESAAGPDGGRARSPRSIRPSMPRPAPQAARERPQQGREAPARDVRRACRSCCPSKATSSPFPRPRWCTPPTATRSSSSRTRRTSRARRHGPDGKPAKVARQQFVRAGRGARRLRRHRRRRQGRPGARHRRRLQAAQRRRRRREQRRQARARSSAPRPQNR